MFLFMNMLLLCLVRIMDRGPKTRHECAELFNYLLKLDGIPNTVSNNK